MPSNRAPAQVPVYLHARVPSALYEAVAAHAEAFDISLSESVRRLLLSALSGVQLTITDADGTRSHSVAELSPALADEVSDQVDPASGADVAPPVASQAERS